MCEPLIALLLPIDRSSFRVGLLLPADKLIKCLVVHPSILVHSALSKIVQRFGSAYQNLLCHSRSSSNHMVRRIRLEAKVTRSGTGGSYGFTTILPNIWLFSKYSCAERNSLSGNAR